MNWIHRESLHRYKEESKRSKRQATEVADGQSPHEGSDVRRSAFGRRRDVYSAIEDAKLPGEREAIGDSEMCGAHGEKSREQEIIKGVMLLERSKKFGVINRQGGRPYNEERGFPSASLPITPIRRVAGTTSVETSRDMAKTDHFEHETRTANDMAKLNDRCRINIGRRARKEFHEIQKENAGYWQEVIERIKENEIRGNITPGNNIYPDTRTTRIAERLRRAIIAGNRKIDIQDGDMQIAVDDFGH